MIYEITAFARDKHYGRALNEHIRHLPDDGWINVRDGDVMFLEPFQRRFMYEAIEDHPEVSLFTCVTNRIQKKLDPDPDVTNHIKKAVELAKVKNYSHITGTVPAFFWLFPKRVWNEVPFDDHPILWPPNRPNSFDVRWSRQVRGTKMRMNHLYIFHLYRLGREKDRFKHLK